MNDEAYVCGFPEFEVAVVADSTVLSNMECNTVLVGIANDRVVTVDPEFWGSVVVVVIVIVVVVVAGVVSGVVSIAAAFSGITVLVVVEMRLGECFEVTNIGVAVPVMYIAV